LVSVGLGQTRRPIMFGCEAAMGEISFELRAALSHANRQLLFAWCVTRDRTEDLGARGVPARFRARQDTFRARSYHWRFASPPNLALPSVQGQTVPQTGSFRSRRGVQWDAEDGDERTWRFRRAPEHAQHLVRRRSAEHDSVGDRQLPGKATGRGCCCTSMKSWIMRRSPRF